MSGLEAIELKLSEMLHDNEGFRWDSEFFKKEYLAALRTVEKPNSQCLRDAAGRIIHPIEIVREYCEEGIQIVLAQNVRDNLFDFTNKAFMAASKEAELSENLVVFDDVVMTRSGANFGQTACYKSRSRVFACADVLVIKRKQIPGGYLSTFFNTCYGRLLLDRGSYGMAQPHIAPPYLRGLPIPRFAELETRIDELVQQSVSKFNECDRTLQATSDLLFASLGLASWQPNDSPTCTRSARDVFAAGRFDADYFRPRYQSLLTLLRRQGKTLRDVARLREDVFTPQPGQPFHYIEIGDLATDGAATSHVVPGEEAPSRATWIVQPGDVITSTVRPIRCLTGLIEPEQAGNICSSGFAVLTPKGIPGELLFAYLRLPVICELMDLHTTASMYPAISTTDLMRLPFLLPDDATIKKVKQQITAARAARREAHALLEKAKLAVEVAIEKNETAAMAALTG